MTDLREALIKALTLDTDSTGNDSFIAGQTALVVDDLILPVIAAHEAEVVGRILDRIDALHQREANPIPRSLVVHICSADRDYFPCPTRRLTAEIRGELSHG